MPGYEAFGYIFVYYPHSETMEYHDDLGNDDEEEELKSNERKIAAFEPHPEGKLKITYPVYSLEEFDNTYHLLLHLLLL